MPVDQYGQKWSCESCIRGHRSTTCGHWDRVMVRVKRTGRPLRSCPHEAGGCACGQERMVMVKIMTNGKDCLCTPATEVDQNGKPIRIFDVPSNVAVAPSIQRAASRPGSRGLLRNDRKISFSTHEPSGLLIDGVSWPSVNCLPLEPQAPDMTGECRGTS